MIRLRANVCLTTILALVGACSSRKPPEVHPLPDPVTIAADADSVWPAIIDVVTEFNLPLEWLDRASGYLKTDRIGSTNPDWWDCGTGPGTDPDDPWAGWYGDKPLLVTTTVAIAVVPLGDGGSQVRITTAPQGVKDQKPVQCTSRGSFESELYVRIVERWQELRGR